MKKLVLTFLLGFITASQADAQLLQGQRTYTKADSLRGSLRQERHYDVRKYHLNLLVNPEEKFISGSNGIEFIPDEKLTTMQIDLFENMKVDSIIYNQHPLKYRREFNAVFVSFDKPLPAGERQSVTFYYSGHPIVAKNAPWDGGFVFTKDKNEKTWVATACQGTGASLWWPNKDHQTDEPDEGMTIQVAAPNEVMNVSNGRFLGSKNLGNGYTRWDWEVKNPINNYDVAVNIGDYVHFGENYKGLDLDFYVLRDHLDMAKKQFAEVKPMLDCFQEKFGEYPFIEDGYKLVETPHLGMEHQSAVAYGNKYKMGYLGRDLSGTGVGLKTDFIIIHESGHEWFGNSITSKDIADMWIHEGFTSYADAVYLECQFGYEDSQKYLKGISKNILNDRPVIGDYGVNSEGSSDMYYKGANMLNTLRHVINDDAKWWSILHDFTAQYKHQMIDTKEVVSFFEEKSGLQLAAIFDQYLKYKSIPILELQQSGKDVMYRWKTDVADFNMPVAIELKGESIRLDADNNWKKLKHSEIGDVNVDTDHFLIKVSDATTY